MAKETVRVSEAAGERKRKKTPGRQEIEIKPIRCAEERHLCFTERREGLVKKATKLCVLTGAQVAIVVFSPAGKPYSFGYPSVKAVVERCYRNPAAAAEATRATSALSDCYGECERLREAVQAEARRRDELDAAVRAAGAWAGGDDDDVHSWGMPRLVAMLAALERVQAEVAERVHEMTAEEAERVHEMIAEEAMIMNRYYGVAGGGTFFTAESGASSGRLQGGMHTQMMLLGGAGDVRVRHAAHAPWMDAPLPSPPMTTTLPPDLPPPPPPPQLPYKYGCAGSCCYDHGYDSGHGGPCGMEGWCCTIMAICNLFGRQRMFTDRANSEQKSLLN